jgi:hypothetical protein
MPLNIHVRERLSACLAQLRAAYAGGRTMSSASKGNERELFVEVFLKNVLPPAFRFGTGDITDTHGRRSGQVDLVVEHNTVPSFPLVGTAIPRLYLAEGVAAAIEVKSDLSSQWNEALATASSVAALHTTSGAPVPFFIVGYRGWKALETLERHACAAGDNGARLTGVLCLDPPYFIGGRRWPEPVAPVPHPEFPGVMIPQPPNYVNKHLIGEGESALFCLLALLHDCTTQLIFGQNALLQYTTLTEMPVAAAERK